MSKRDMLCDCDVIHAEIVELVSNKMPKKDELVVLSDFFKVLGDSTRASIIAALDESEMCVCDLAVLLNMTKSAISHQLSYLKRANLVKHRKEGRNVFYSLTDDHVREIFEKSLEHLREARDSE